MRAAIYARFSSDLQDARSIQDQVDLARKYAQSRSLNVAGVYEDAGISGASVINRPGLQKLLADAKAGEIEVLVTESLDRLSRSQADIATLYERLSFLGVRVETLADGLVSEIHIGLKGTMAALFLKDLAQKTRRGQMGRVKAGRIPGGRSYGYDVVHAGEDRGQRVINESEAAIVRRIYQEYAEGRGTLDIVRSLNQEGVAGPSGKGWNVSTLIGSPKRRNGLLNNELYRGTIVYNRQRFLKDPSTGRRVARANPEVDWLRQECPQLRIVDEATWQQVQSVRAGRGGTRPHEKRRPQRLLSGLIVCGCCGARYNVATRDYLRCSARTNKGTCSESRLIRMTEVEERVLGAIEKHLLAPEMIEAAIEAYRQEYARGVQQSGASRKRIEAELAETERKLKRMMTLVEDGHADVAVAGPRINELAGTKKRLASELAEEGSAAAPIVIPDGGASYRKMVSGLRQAISDGEPGTHEAVALIRGLVQRITVKPETAKTRQAIEITAGSADYCNGGCGGWI